VIAAATVRPQTQPPFRTRRRVHQQKTLQMSASKNGELALAESASSDCPEADIAAGYPDCVLGRSPVPG